MTRRFFDTECWKWIRTGLEIAFIVLTVLAVIWVWHAFGFSEAYADEEKTAYVICAPGDRVNIRVTPSTKREPEGWLEAGDMVYLDGRKKNGFAHCVHMSNESGEGWVHAGYLVDDEPQCVNSTAVIVSKGRLAARKNVGGKRTRWLKPLATLTVYYWSDEWCVTNCGYVQSKFLDLEEP